MCAEGAMFNFWVRKYTMNVQLSLTRHSNIGVDMKLKLENQSIRISYLSSFLSIIQLRLTYAGGGKWDKSIYEEEFYFLYEGWIWGVSPSLTGIFDKVKVKSFAKYQKFSHFYFKFYMFFPKYVHVHEMEKEVNFTFFFLQMISTE